MVDDDPDIRVIAEMALSAVGGMRVALACSGHEAVMLAGETLPDVILLDMMMPGIDGRATFGKLQESAVTASIPVIFMTAKVQSQEVQSYLDLGAIGVIPKPFDPMTLADQVRKLLGALK